MGKIIALANNKGGVGKTTASRELGAVWHELGFKVLMLDCDEQCNLSASYNIDQHVGSAFDEEDEEREPAYPGIMDLLSGKKRFQDVVLEIEEGLDLIPGNPEISLLPTWKEGDPDIEKNTAMLLKMRKTIIGIDKLGIYDFIIIDTAPATNLIMQLALTCSDLIIIPSTVDKYALDGIRNVFGYLYRWKSKNMSNAEIAGAILINCSDRYDVTKEFRRRFDDIKEKYSSEAFLYVCHSSVSTSEVTYETGSVLTNKKPNKVSNDYKKIVGMIMRQWLLNK